jgi:dynein heavy chain
VLLVPASRMTESSKLMRLWVHEVYRVFNDRLIDEGDRLVLDIPSDDCYMILFRREKFFGIVRDVCQDSFKTSIDKVLGHLTMSGKVKDEHIRSLFFGDYMNPDGERIYDEVTDLKQLTKIMEQ